jgi:hypothetical protein
LLRKTAQQIEKFHPQISVQFYAPNISRHLQLPFRPLQVDYLLTRFPQTGTGTQSQNNLRVSTGIVVHF